jgi:hypothetical protein
VLSDFLIKVIVVLLPTQLGLHFWPAFSRVAGIKVDYLSPTLYLIDILLIFLVILNFNSLKDYFNKNKIYLGIFLAFVLANIALAVSPLNSLFWWLRCFLYILVFIVFRLKKLTWENIRTPLLYGTILVVFIEILQLFKQSSLSGIFYYLGERAFTASTPGLGHLNLLGQDLIRPMSIFSHPNSLAGYLLVVFYLFSKNPSKSWHKLIPFLGILFASSKSSIIALAFIIFNLKPELTILLSLIFTLIQPLAQNFSFTWQSVSDRLFFFPYLNQISPFDPITGVGLGGFIPTLGKLLPGSLLTPSKLQPIHNLYFLYISELGTLGTVLLALTLLKRKIYKTLTNPLVLGLIAIILFTGAFDHYTWTLPQNKLIFILALSILF